MKIGIFGVGHLGEIHIKCIQKIAELSLIGFYDPDITRAATIAEKYQIKSFSSPDSLIEATDIVDIVSPTVSHFQIAKNALLSHKHLFIEKPLTHTLAEARALLKLYAQLDFQPKIQIGHVERFNPVFQALENIPLTPMFIEGHRLSQFSIRGTDVSVILDLMIHDIDMVLKLANSKIKYISASGVGVISNKIDIANARLEFENGCVANLTASRISLKKMRKLRIFQKDAYISLDFLDKKAQIVRLSDKEDILSSPSASSFDLETDAGKRKISIEIPQIPANNAIEEELKALYHSIVNDKPTSVSLQDGFRALKVAHQIIKKIHGNLKKMSS